MTVVTLDRVPDLRRLYARGAAGSAVSAARRSRTVDAGALPTTRLAVRGVTADAAHLTAYQHLLHEPASDVLPAGFVHVLAFPVAMALMTGPFPLPLLGMVHLANQVEQRRPVALGEALDVVVHAQELRAHRSGVTVDVVAEVTVGDEPVWHGTSTYLAKGLRLSGDSRPAGDAGSGADAAPGSGSATGGTAAGADAAPSRTFTPPTPTGQWRLPADTGRRYAAVSGDANPIHLSALAARAFGFRRPIAHGMYTAARALADVGPATRGEAFVWDVEFARPVELPSTVTVRVAPVWTAADASGVRSSGTVVGFAGWDARRGRPHLTGSVTRLV